MRMIGFTVPYCIIGMLMFIGVRGIANIVQSSLTIRICVEVVFGIILFSILVFMYESISRKRVITSLIKDKVFGNIVLKIKS